MNDNDRAARVATLVTQALQEYDNKAARTMQSREGILGPSDIGFCRNKAALVTKQVQPTDERPMWAANVGTAIHNYVEGALKAAYPDWLMGSIDNIHVVATLPSGAEIGGHPDVVVPAANAVLDIKTVDGFEWIKREGASRSHKYQRHLYAMGLVQQGILSEDNLYVGNIYFDRSGKEPTPIIELEPFDPTLTDEIDSWIQDVIYAVKNNEDASRDIAAPVCERICEFFTVCRGGLEVHEGGMEINDPELLSAVDMYVEARDLEKRAQAMKKEAQSRLYGVNGSTGEYQVRWTQVNPTTVESFERPGYDRMDVRKVRR